MSDAAKHELARRVFEAIGGQAQVEETLRSVLKMTFETSGDGSPELFAELDKAIAGDTTLATVWLDALERAMEPEELELLLEFYGAPHGKKMVAIMPRLTALVAGAFLKWQAEVLTPGLEKLVR